MWTRSEVFTHFTSGLERRKHVALPQLSRVREYLVEFERSEELYLVTGVQVLSSPHIKIAFGRFFVIWTRSEVFTHLTSGLEKVASDFGKIVTTCTDPVRIKIPVEHNKTAFGRLCIFFRLEVEVLSLTILK
ncbi:MAG: hypothetical protein ACI92I_000734 [Acidimicrobiales bacterium]|jgi:hypothetical protein